MNKNKSIVPIKIQLTDIITPKSCSLFIAELIKYVVFNKEQIPYPYEHLKMFVFKRREHLKTEVTNEEKIFGANGRVSFLMEKYYKKVEAAFETLNAVFKCIEQKLLDSYENPVEEVVLLFGATPISPKDIYRIKVPALSFGHLDGQHIWRKQVANLFRDIIVSDDVNTNIQRKVGMTNMFVMIKVRGTGCLENIGVLPKDNYQLSERSHQVEFSFSSTVNRPCCCLTSDVEESLSLGVSKLELTDENLGNDSETCDTDNQSVWFQVSESLKGFRDSKSDGKSIIDLWHKHNFTF